jgi:fumarate hydratase class II
VFVTVATKANRNLIAGKWVDAKSGKTFTSTSPANRDDVLGYEEAASIAKQALAERKSIRDVVIERGHVDAGRITLEDLDRLLDVRRMTTS